jgi:hypothetical protein
MILQEYYLTARTRTTLKAVYLCKDNLWEMEGLQESNLMPSSNIARNMRCRTSVKDN